MNIHVCDIESFWDSKEYTLSKMGSLEYSRDPRAACQMLGVSTNGGPVNVQTEYTGREVAARLQHFDWANDVFVAHNGANFDFVFLHENFEFDPQHMWDSIFMERWCGLSSICGESHAALTEKLGNGIKRNGTATSDKKHWPQDFTEEERKDFTRYCAEDVAQCRDNVKVMLPYMTSDCLRFMSLTARMATRPVFVLNAPMLEEYIRQLDEEAEEARKTLMELFHFPDLPSFFQALRSADKFAEMLRSFGVEPPTKVSEKKTATAIAKAKEAGDEDKVRLLQQEPIRAYAFSKTDVDFLALAEHEDPRVRLLVETRLEFNSSVMRSRAETLLKFARHNKPIPIMLSAFKAHTSRYTAGTGEGKTDGLQFQNLAKRNPAYLPLRKAIQVPKGMKVVAVDSSQIEARCLAWEANEFELLGHFRDGRDPYAEFATNFGHGMTAKEIHDGAKSGDKKAKHFRNLAKKFILSAGYGVGSRKVSAALWQDKIRLHDNYDEHSKQAAEYLRIYRAKHSAIVYFWKVCQSVIEALARGESGEFGGPNGNTFRYGMMDVVGRFPVASIMFPSGYALRYPNLRAVAGEQRVEYVYDQHKGKNVVPSRIYSGLLANNLTQGFSFQILMWQACRMDEVGIELKGNIHDCWFTVVPETEAQATADKMVYWMRQLPPWAQGLPLDAESWIGDNFTGV